MYAKYFTSDETDAYRDRLDQRRKELMNFLRHAGVYYTVTPEGEVIVTETEDAEVVSVETVRDQQKLLRE